jgi:Mrp family chromosome partitioning ATPase
VHAQREDLEAKIGLEADRIVASLESQATTAQARVAALQQQLDGVLGTRTRNREAELQLGELQRKAGASQRLYELFLQQSKEAEEAAAIVVPGGRVLARAAVPDSPSTPGLTMFAIFGLISSAMAGGVIGLLRDRLDDRVRDAQQVRAAVGLPCIATIPKLDRRDDRPGRKADGGLDAYVEAMRSVLAAMHLRGDGPPRMVLVTSPLPGEGRTTLSASLAAYAARLGRRVLLIDLDTRRGQGGRTEETGLVDRLLSDLPFEDLIRRDDALRVDFIASGRQRGDLMTLLLNGQLRQLLWRLGGCYDLVVVDCPPVLAAADARMLAPIVDRVLLVVRWNTTRIPLLRGAVETLREVGANVAGVVLVQAPSPRLLRARRPAPLRLAASGPEATEADPAPAAPGGIAAQVRGFALSARRRRGAAAAPQRATRPRPFAGLRERGG